MNIVYLTNQFPPNIWGGLGIYVNFLTEQISENNKLWVYTTNSGCLDFFEDKGNVKIYRPIRPFLRGFLQRKKSSGHYTLASNVIKAVDLLLNNLDCFFLLKENLPNDRYDVIVVHDFMHSLTGLLCKFFLKIPIIFHVHAMEYTIAQEGYIRWPINVMRRFFESMLAKNAQSIIVGT
jgi:glycogen(starch) synthase